MRGSGGESHGRRASFGRLLVVLLIATLSIGCGSSEELAEGIPISGKVTYKGEPLNGGIVIYEPAGSGATAKTASKDAEIKSEGRTAIGYIQSDGTFTMNTSRGIPGVVPGKYQIGVREGEAPAGAPGQAPAKSAAPKDRNRKSTIPEKYQQPATSGLTDVVNEQHSGTKVIELVD